MFSSLTATETASAQPSSPLHGVADSHKVAAVGHSAGGQTAFDALNDPRVAMAVGWAPVGPSGPPSHKPVTIIGALQDVALTPATLTAEFHKFPGPTKFVEISGEGHNTYTDICTSIRQGSGGLVGFAMSAPSDQPAAGQAGRQRMHRPEHPRRAVLADRAVLHRGRPPQRPRHRSRRRPRAGDAGPVPRLQDHLPTAFVKLRVCGPKHATWFLTGEPAERPRQFVTIEDSSRGSWCSNHGNEGRFGAMTIRRTRSRWTRIAIGLAVVLTGSAAVTLVSITPAFAKVNCQAPPGPSVNLRACSLIGANLSGKDLEGAKLIHADLSGANLSGANLSGARLVGAVMTGANLTSADLTHANVDQRGSHQRRPHGRQSRQGPSRGDQAHRRRTL